jgi:protein TonB
MFQNLIESASHRKDLARRGRFFLGTLAFYGVIVAVVGVASVYAYNVRLDEQNYEVTMLPPWAIPRPIVEADPPDRPSAPRRAGTNNEAAQRPVLYADLHTVTSTPPPISTVYNPIPPVTRGVPTVIGNHISDPLGGVGPGNGSDGGGGVPITSHPIVRVPVDEVEDIPPPVRVAPTPKPPQVLKLSQLVSSKIVSKPVPPYPMIARAAHIEGLVSVEILVDEQGRVISATAKDGPAMLREAARLAALQARFTPTQLNGQPVKISGVISYNFTLR